VHLIKTENQAKKTHYNTENPIPNATNKTQNSIEKKPNFETQKAKNQCKTMTNGQRIGKNKEQNIKTHNKGWTKDRRQQTNEIEAPQKRKNTSYKLHSKH
jgi:hypothetical protein